MTNDIERKASHLNKMSTILSKIMTKILETDDVDSIIDELLNDVMRLYGAGRAYLVYSYHDRQDTTYSVFHTQCPEAQQYEWFKTHRPPFMSFYAEKISNGEIVVVNDREALPDECADVRDYLRSIGVRAQVAVPVNISRKSIAGLFGIDVFDRIYQWEKHDLEWLRSITNMAMMWRQLKRTQDKADVERNNSLDVLEKMPVGLLTFDINGTVEKANARALEIFSIDSVDDIAGFNIFSSNLLCDHTKEQIKTRPYYDSFFNFYRGYKPLDQGKAPKGTPMFRIDTRYSKLYDNAGRMCGYLGAYIDRSSDYQNSEAVRDLDGIIAMTAEVAKMGYARINIINDRGYATRQWYANNRMEYQDSYMGMMGFLDHVHPDDRHLITDFRRDVRAGLNPVLNALTRVLRSEDGGWDYVRVYSVVTRFEPEKDIIEVSAITQNVNKYVDMNERLQREKERAEAADKLKTAFLANMSHEIRTPLNAILGFSKLLCRDDVPQEDREEIISIVEQNNELLLQLVSDILDLSKLEAGIMEFKKAEMDANSVCRNVAASAYIRPKKGVKVMIDCPQEKCMIVSDVNRLQQVMFNFANNAAKFTKKGQITIGYRLCDNDRIRFFVADTGKGVSREMQLAIFERFVKADSFSQGAGIGLEISREIVSRLDGKIGVESEEGKGSTFWCEIPRQ